MSNTLLAEIFVPLVVAVAIAVWIFWFHRADRRPGHARQFQGGKPRREGIGGTLFRPDGRPVSPLSGRQAASDDDLRDPETRELDEAGIDYVDFGVPERERRRLVRCEMTSLRARLQESRTGMTANPFYAAAQAFHDRVVVVAA